MHAPAEDVDLDALVARLKEEVRKAGSEQVHGSARSAARAQAERSWPVSAERRIVGRPGPRGAVARPAKLVLRTLMRWYVEPLAADQRVFNDAALKLIDALSEEADVLREQVAALEQRARRADELEERVVRLERRPAGAGASTIAAQPTAAALPDYFAFESRMRGASAEIRERQRPYVADLCEAAPVLDVGCGRGELLALLREAGVEARGVDADADMAAFARGEGLDVEQADALAYLERLPDGSLGGIFTAQVVEHLPPPALVRLLELSAAKLRSGGLLVAETINPLSPLALRNYFADLTHAQPLVPETLELLARHAGFARTEIRLLNPPARRLDGDDDDARLLNDIVFAPLDYALLART
jgi:SAM-dependent methyltransferase